ncbi:MAG TPA: sugar ABC transporter ATP-binding protein [Roseiarcus sp.]|nr:sugar ABC transporter ATP-binding protein [Roseiarcus sp.]
MTPVLEIKGVSKSFPGVKALDDVSFSVQKGEVIGLIGENGAGKSSLLKVLNGIYQPDAGSVYVDGNPVKLTSPRDAFDKGIAMVFQEQLILPTLTVAENIFLGREEEFLRYGLISKARMNAAAAVELRKVQLDVHPGKRCADLTFADRQMVEIAKALSLDSRINGDVTILLDEPTSVLEKKEIDLLFRIVEELKQRASIVFISHRMEEVLAISDRVYVMRDGKIVFETPGKSATIKTLHQHMVGRQLHNEYYREARQAPATNVPVLEARDLGKRGCFSNVSFTLHEGEILGIAGVIGSGREDLAKCLAGHKPIDTGALKIGGKSVTFRAAHDAKNSGIGLIPSERKIEGLVASFSVAENMTLAALPKFVARGVISFKQERQISQDWVARLKIKTPSTATMVSSLSGGNQQKVVLAKWRVAGVRIVILDHPTRGIDVGAKEDVYELIRDMTAEGMAVILLGDTLEEVIGMSSRILVMRDGEIVATFDAAPGKKPTQVELVEHMV